MNHQAQFEIAGVPRVLPRKRLPIGRCPRHEILSGVKFDREPTCTILPIEFIRHHQGLGLPARLSPETKAGAHPRLGSGGTGTVSVWPKSKCVLSSHPKSSPGNGLVVDPAFAPTSGSKVRSQNKACSIRPKPNANSHIPDGNFWLLNSPRPVGGMGGPVSFTLLTWEDSPCPRH